MKKSILFLCIFSLATMVFSQESESITVPLSSPNTAGSLSLYNHDGTISIEGYEGSEVIVNIVSKETNRGSSKSRNGLKRLANNSLGISIVEERNHVDINSSNNNRKDYEIKVPYDFSLNVSTHHNGQIYISNVKGYLEVNSHHGGIEIEGVDGAVVADTHHGEIKVVFIGVSKDEPMAFTTYHGDVDITFPIDLSADLKMKSRKGEIYTDFDVSTMRPKLEESKQDGRNEIKVSGWTYGKVKSGGPEYRFDTYHGDVIIRKRD